MSDELYDQLSDLFNKIGFGGRKGPEMNALLQSLFNEDEAATALNLSPFAPEPPASVAERMGEDPDILAGRLDEMADKGLIYASSRGAEKRYKTIQLVPGIFELQFMKGEYNALSTMHPDLRAIKTRHRWPGGPGRILPGSFPSKKRWNMRSAFFHSRRPKSM
jgi:hypothetical protein